MLYKVYTTGYVIFMYRIYLERNCIDGGFMNSLKRFKTVILKIVCMIGMCVFGTNLIDVPYKGSIRTIMHVCNFFFNDNVYKMM